MTAIEQARVALERGSWSEALSLLGAGEGAGSLGHTRSAEALELTGQARYGKGDFEGAIDSFERLYALQSAAGDDVEAARAALTAALYLLIDSGLLSPVRAWVRRAERLLEAHPDVPPHAMVAQVLTYERFLSGDPEGARVQATRAVELGERFGMSLASVMGRVALARLKISAGDVDEGLEALDEVAVLLLSGEVDAMTTGMMFCELICAAQSVARLDRAREWTEMVDRWRHDSGFGTINGRCRVHRAELLRVSGPGVDAEREALEACAELRPWMRREFGWPLAELGNIRLRRGDLAGAEEAFLGAHAHAWSPQPGLALLRLEQGQVDEALALITDAIEHPLQTPSKEHPPFDDLRLAPLLEAQVEIAAAAGDVVAAGTAAARLADIAEHYASPGLHASSSLATARVHMAAADPASAVLPAQQAVAGWSTLEAPCDAAIARTVLGQAYMSVGAAARGRMEWMAALDALDHFGANRRAREVRALLGSVPGAPAIADPAAAETARPMTEAMFLRQGTLRRIVFLGTEVTLRDLKGYRYLERMLDSPGREWHVLDLITEEQGSPTGPVETGIPVLDEDARVAYRRRLTEVDQEIDEATSMNDLGRLELAQNDRDYLVAELTSAFGLGGRGRRVNSSAERARTSVARCLRYALDNLAQEHAGLAAHLRAALHTGTYCSYRTDPLAVIEWRVSETAGGDGGRRVDPDRLDT